MALLECPKWDSILGTRITDEDSTQNFRKLSGKVWAIDSVSVGITGNLDGSQCLIL